MQNKGVANIARHSITPPMLLNGYRGNFFRVEKLCLENESKICYAVFAIQRDKAMFYYEVEVYKQDAEILFAIFGRKRKLKGLWKFNDTKERHKKILELVMMAVTGRWKEWGNPIDNSEKIYNCLTNEKMIFRSQKSWGEGGIYDINKTYIYIEDFSREKTAVYPITNGSYYLDHTRDFIDPLIVKCRRTRKWN